MPLLDRTAARLEPSGLRRLLPRGAKPGSRSSRALLSDCSRRQETGSGFFDMFSPELSLVEPLAASSFVLDFLYPKGALSFLGRPSGGRPSSWPFGSAHDHRKSTGQLQSLLSSTAALESDASTPQEAVIDHSNDNHTSSSAAYDNRALSLEEQQTAVFDTLTGLIHAHPGANNYDAFDRSWNLYLRLEDGPRKTGVVRPLLHSMASSRRVAEAKRILHLVDQLDPELWDALTVEAAVRANLHGEKDRAAALALFQRSSATKAWADGAAPGMDLLLAEALITYSWHGAAEVWDVFKQKTEQNKAPASLLKAVVDMPNLPAILQMFSTYINTEASEIANDTNGSKLESLKEVFKAILEASLDRVDPNITFPLVQALTNPRVLEKFINVAIDKKMTQLAAKAYSEYRLMPRYKPRTETLVNMVHHVYYPDNVRGMEEVLKDWNNAKGRPNFWGYQKYLAFYASRGDVASVYRLWNEFVTAYPTAIESAQDTFAHLLKVHAVRGDVAQVEQTFSEIKSKYNVDPNIICWNIRLHHHVERGDYAKAMAVFEDLCQAVHPDDYSFGTIMSLVGSRGDLDLVLDLYWLAQQCGVPMSESIIDPIVEAYCQNDRHDEAERLCVTTTRERTALGAPYTALWNTLLQHHAYRHDLVAVNRILNVMTRLHVKYDDGTYSALLFALAQCRQPRRAAELLRVAQEDHIFKPTANHFTLLMMAYIRSKQPHRALQVNRLMHHMGFQRSSQQIQMVIKAFSQWQEYPKGDASGPGSASERRDLFAKALREFQRSLAVPDREPSLASSRKTQQAVGREAARMHLGAVRRFSFVIFMLVQARDFAGVEEVMQLYRSIVSDDERQRPLPLKLCNALMLSDFYEGRFNRVKEMWQDVIGRTREISRPQRLKDTRLESILGHTGPKSADADQQTDIEAAIAGNADNAGTAQPVESAESELSSPPAPEDWNTRRVVAKLQYGLTDPLKTMQRLYAAERDPDGLMQVINKDVLANGFMLDSKNWNHYVQHLARLGRITDAFAVCEERLMKRWSGFSVLRARHGGMLGESGNDASGRRRYGMELTMERNTHKASIRNAKDLRDALRDDLADEQQYNGSGAEQDVNRTGGAKLRMSRLRQIRESATRYNVPMTYTLMVLAKAYMELEQMSMWSSAAEREFHELAAKSPKSVNAVRAMVSMNSHMEGRIFGRGDEDGVATDFNLLSIIGDNGDRAARRS